MKYSPFMKQGTFLIDLFIDVSQYSYRSVQYSRPSDRVQLKNANYAIFSGQIVQLERPIMR